MSIRKTKDADIEYGKKDKLQDSDFEPRQIGHRISIVVPEDVLMAYRKEASKKGVGYQTLMNQVLREHLFGDENIVKRIHRLERAVFKKQGQR